MFIISTNCQTFWTALQIHLMTILLINTNSQSFAFFLQSRCKFQFKEPDEIFNSLNLLLYSLSYAEACNEFVLPISLSLRLRAPQILLKECCSGGDTVFNLTGPRFELKANALPLNQLACSFSVFLDIAERPYMASRQKSLRS